MTQRMPDAEARAILSKKRYCPDPAEWRPYRTQAGSYILETGVVNDDGSRSGLSVQFILHRGAKTGLAEFRFDLFRSSLTGPESVYGIHIKQSPRAARIEHNWPHEHIGSARNVDRSWIGWGYPEVLARFCEQTGIEFQPPPPDPEDFRLTS